MEELLKAIELTVNNECMTDAEKVQYIKDYFRVAKENAMDNFISNTK